MKKEKMPLVNICFGILAYLPAVIEENPYEEWEKLIELALLRFRQERLQNPKSCFKLLETIGVNVTMKIVNMPPIYQPDFEEVER